MRDWVRGLALAMRFLTRLPLPNEQPDRFQDDIGRALSLFPLVGALIGAFAALPLLIGASFWPLPVAVLLTLIVEARLTGALHEDAVADLCDALGGGRTKTDRLKILQDSRVGAYGALGLMLAVALRACGLLAAETSWRAAAVLVIAGGFGRLLMLISIVAIPIIEVRASLATGIKSQANWKGVLQGTAILIPVILLGLWISPMGTVMMFLAGIGFVLWFRELLICQLGGSTGDALGFAAYAGTIIATLALTARV